MTVAESHLAELSEDQRQVLESWLVDFDLSWDKGRLASWVARLPPASDGLRRAALLEMVKIDLERRWRGGQRACLEAYAKALPELGTTDSLPADLIHAEYEARQHGGVPADLAEFAQRFPRQADQLRRLVEQSQADSRASGLDSCYSFVLAEVPPRAPSLLLGQSAGGPAGLPESFGRYRILRKLGQGAMGSVYLAHDCQLDRQVALKVPHFADTDGPEVGQRFLSEARAAANITHPNICPVYDVGEINGTPYLTMAYLEGQPLAQILKERTRLPPRQAAVLVGKMALALQEAHDHGVIHRDLKPSNVVINQRGEPIILDFGLARRLRPGDARLTVSGQPLGSPAYMAPEQAAGAVGDIGPACDIYSLGVILYQLLTGRLPFEGSMAEVLGQIVSRRPEPPSTHRPDLDPDLEGICLQALSKEAADRYASMRALAAALEKYVGVQTQQPGGGAAPGSAVQAPAGGGAGAGQFALFGGNRLRAALVAGSAVAFLLAGLALWALWAPSSTGTLQILLDDPRGEVEVRVDGQPIERTRLGEPLRFRTGEHHLLVTGSQIQPVNESFTVVRGDNPVLRVRFVLRVEVDPVRTPHRRHEDDDDDDDDDRPRTHRMKDR
jgi:predicted Ser/Thr protein kinase